MFTYGRKKGGKGLYTRQTKMCYFPAMPRFFVHGALCNMQRRRKHLHATRHVLTRLAKIKTLVSKTEKRTNIYVGQALHKHYGT